MMMRIFATKSIQDVDTHDSTISITLSGETAETFSETCTEPLLPSRDCPSSDDHSDHVEMPRTTSGGKVKVFLATHYLYIYIYIYIYIVQKNNFF
jgi:hypothetical protein